MITCGRFDPLIVCDPALIAKSTAVRRIVAPNPNCLQPFQFTPIATDGHHVLHAGGLEELHTFLASHVASGTPPLVVLTNREYLATLEAASLRGCRLYSFERQYPLFPQLRHAPSLQANLATLRKLLRKVGQLGIVASSFSRDQSTRHLHHVAKALKFKSGLDRFFFFSLREGHQEVYKHVEERPERAVVALDFNSMFADCLRGSFCEPRAIRHRVFDRQPAALDALDEGIYRIVLRGARPGFIQDHHPFLFRRLGRSFHFRLDVGGSLETLLHKSELLHFARFFDAVDVKEGFCSPRSIAHPLAAAAERLYARRRHARSRGDGALEQFCKSSLQLMHSATNQRHDKRTGFASPRELRDFLASNYALSLDAQVPPADLQRFLGRTAYFGVRDHADGLELRHLDIDAAGAVYCLSSGVLANARVKLLAAIERFVAFDSVEVCYANIDSVHLSIAKDRLDAFLRHFKDFIGDSLGQMRVEAIADRGYWFDVGRYWLLKDERVVQFRNRGFNNGRSQDAFVSRRWAYTHHEAEAFSHLRPFVMRLEDSFSYTKKLGPPGSGTTDFIRCSIEEIKTAAAMNATEAAEMLRSRGQKVELFAKLAGEAR
ncbi:hypothetical protein WKW79_28950 [Variovorax robiniae]|uniref:DNA-directed DNA polymerase n=1 Tax=Variovorax robiniae TaxID=1836199 RepID=A0ABU8XFI3_9BURK